MAPAAADEVSLINGDRLAGKVTSLDGSALALESAMLGKITIPRERIRDIAIKRVTDVRFSDGRRAEGAIAVERTGWMRLRAAGGWLSGPFRMPDLAAVGDAAAPAEAQAKAAEWRTRGEVNLGFDATEGNSDTESYHGDAKIVAHKADHRLTGRAEANFESDEGNEIANDSLVSLKHDHFYTERWYFYTTGTAARDSIKDLDVRADVGTGPGYQIVDSARASASVEGGVSYVVEDFSTNDDDGSYGALRWSGDLRYDPLAKTLRAFHFHELLVGVAGDENVVLRTRTGLKYLMEENLQLTAQVNYDWEAEVPPGTENADVKYILTLGYSW